ncbi:MAG: hypothetical protein KAJ37_05660, partial [Candidatus Krumholzibacteria bacterium]|nr:hypothetical protein [Candidatus Krumholzibacteria bacterium]
DGLFAALQHHVHYNNNGYPQKPGGWDLRLISRITTVADYYDAMTTPRIYQDPCTPDKTLLFILQKSGEIFDPFIAKVFIQAMGIYPIGTVVELDTGEKAAVVRQNDNRRFIHRPFVALLGTSGGAEDLIDLTDRKHDGRGYRRTVVRAFYDKTAEIAKNQLFLTDPSD